MAKLDLGNTGLMGGLAGALGAVGDMYGKQAENTEYDRRQQALLLKEQAMAKYRGEIEDAQAVKRNEMQRDNSTWEHDQKQKWADEDNAGYQAALDNVRTPVSDSGVDPSGSSMTPNGETANPALSSDYNNGKPAGLMQQPSAEESYRKLPAKYRERYAREEKIADEAFGQKRSDYSHIKEVKGALVDMRTGKEIYKADEGGDVQWQHAGSTLYGFAKDNNGDLYPKYIFDGSQDVYGKSKEPLALQTDKGRIELLQSVGYSQKEATDMVMKGQVSQDAIAGFARDLLKQTDRTGKPLYTPESAMQAARKALGIGNEKPAQGSPTSKASKDIDWSKYSTKGK